jgi:beta-glucosidase
LIIGNAILDVITGKVNPSGRLPMSWPKRIEDCTAHINWGAERGKVHYGEGIFVRNHRVMKQPIQIIF